MPPLTSRFLPLGALAAALLAVGGWLGWTRAREAAALRGEIETQRRAIEVQRAVRSERERWLADLTRRTTPAPHPAQERDVRARWREDDERLARRRERLLANPEYAAFERWTLRTEALARYGEWLNLLGLPQLTAARLRDLLAEQELASLEAHVLATASGAADATAETAKRQARADLSAEIAALLGPENAGQFFAVQQALPYRLHAEYFGVALAEAGLRLAPAQVLDLAKALAASFGDKAGPPFATLDPLDDDPARREAFVSRVSAITSSAHAESIRSLLLEENAAREAFFRVTQEEDGP